uniref:NADH-ubiquinone oxidoreductase chain 4 n=1 Tax=Lachesilla sp. LaspMLY TaxID=2597020 RepID=A0A8K1ZG09_9NEOP|nr:NADH dehydrogenase subunit 4 [Lachesilla sp. LaspMLY]
MLKYLFMLVFMIPYIYMDWMVLQILMIFMLFTYMFELGNFEFYESLSWIGSLDLMSYMLIMLSLYICWLSLMSSEAIMTKSYFKNQFMYTLIFLLLFLMLSFYSNNLFMFYIWFESSLIPTFFLILGWGYQSERLQAGMYMFMYTLLFSLPLMLMIFWLFKNLDSLKMFLKLNKFVNMNLIMFLALYMGFLVKLPMFLLHLWLPKAHVEAPVSGSMILAGVLLKLGGYGIIRVSQIFYKHIYKYSYYFIIVSLIGGILISLNCLRQSDMKLLIAYSSVSHMGIMLAGVFCMSSWGMSGSLLLMLSHGLCSSGLFFMSNMFYERVGSRNMMLVKGMIHFMPKMSVWWFFFCVMNMAAPPSLNLLSEIMLINSLVSWSSYNMISLSLMGFFVASYSVFLFSYIQHGKFSSLIFSLNLNYIREFLILFLHWMPLNMMIVFSEICLDWV